MKSYQMQLLAIALLSIAPAIRCGANEINRERKRITLSKTPALVHSIKTLSGEIDPITFFNQAASGAEVLEDIEVGSAQTSNLKDIINLFNFLVFATLPENKKDFSSETFAVKLTGQKEDLKKIFEYFKNYDNTKLTMYYYDDKKHIVLIHFREKDDQKHRDEWQKIKGFKSLAVQWTGNNTLLIWPHDSNPGMIFGSLPEAPAGANTITIDYDSNVKEARKLFKRKIADEDVEEINPKN